MTDTARAGSFHAVGEQIAVTLRDAHAALEGYAEGDSNLRELERCAGHLHSVRGALQVASVYGAGLLADEMESTCRFLLDSSQSGGAVDEGIEALSRAMVQLPSYVERIMEGGRDIPLVMLPLLNDLRAARGKPLLSESTLMLLNGEPLAAAEHPLQPLSDSGAVSLDVAKLRPQFQLGLLGWIKGAETDRNLQRMTAVAAQLEAGAVSQEQHRLWWVVGGVLEALVDSGLDASIALKRLLGQVDREIKRLQQSGADEFTADPPTDLVNNLLYYVARATSNGDRVAAIKSAFHLGEVAPDDEQVDEMRESLAAPSPQLMKTVAGAISEDLGRAKDVLDIYVRTGMEDSTELEAQVAVLRKISDTLGVLGLDRLREAVAAHSRELEELVSADEVEQGPLVTLAAALLEVEDALETELVGLVRSGGASDDDAPVDADYQAVTEAVLRECKVNLAHIKETITDVLEQPSERRGMDALPEQLRGVHAGLTMLGCSRAVEVLDRIGNAIQTNLQDTVVHNEPGRLNRLADAIVSLEYYMETLQAGRKEPVYMLENAERSLQVLEEEEPAAGQVPEATGEYEKTRIIEVPVMAAGDEPPDLELLEVFIEEAREEIESINRHFPVWAGDESDEEVLITLWRSYHTLKGSGRMVGAQLFGEYARSIEDLLNRIISKTIDTGPEVLAFLADAVAATPQLLEQLEAGTEPDADIDALASCAGVFADGGIPEAYTELGEVVTGEGADQAAEDVAESEEPEAEQKPGIDPVLLDILSRETESHITTIRDHLQQSATEGVAIDDGMHHACHTLHGSLAMANVDQAAGLTDALDQFVEQVYRHGDALDAVQREYVAAAVDAVELMIGQLQNPDPQATAPDTEQLEARLQALAVEIAEREEAAAAAAETAAQDVAVIAEPDAEFDAEIGAIFCEEASEILQASDAALQTLSEDPAATDALAELQRHLHTLKGGARMAGLSAMGDLSHELESLLIRINTGSAGFNDEMQSLLQASIDALHMMRENVVDGRVLPADAELMGRIGIASQATMVSTEPVGEAPFVEPPAAETETVDESEATEPEESAAEELADELGETDESAEDELRIPEPEQLGELADDLIHGKAPEAPQPLPETLVPPAAADGGQRKEMARVDSAMLEGLLNNAGEISISHSRLKQQVSSIQFNLDELGQTVQRLQQQLRLLEMETEAQILFKHQNELPESDEQFDPLELDRYSTIQQLSRGLSETASDVSSLKDLLQNIASDTETILSQQQRITSELQDNLMRTRMVPFEQHVPRLQRLVRQQAQESGKRVDLVVKGSSGELDRQVMERMIGPFEHMLRNAVIHGIEMPDDRKAAGKDEGATITIAFRRDGSHVLIDVADDGAGIDMDRVRRKALEQNLIREGQHFSEEELAQLILRSGLSTADQLTQSAGRGIGMDVVVNEISKLGGTLAISTEQGKCCTFTVRLPYTLAITQAFIVRAGAESFALPLPSVEGVVRIDRDEYDQRMSEGEPGVEYGGRRYRLQHLGLYLGLGPARLSAEQEKVSLILVSAGENSTALITDDTADAREIVIKPVGAQLAGIRGVAGATILGDGRIVVILDAPAIVRMPVPEFDPEELQREDEDNLPPLALVVDDSITMRRVTQRLLERNGLRVLTAKDGLEALDLLQDHHPKIILLDVEMPRMDGYEFAGRVRANPETAALPIIMVTSRSGEKHRARAIELGVNDYLGKPYQEHEMLDAINSLLGDGAPELPADQDIAPDDVFGSGEADAEEQPD